MPDQEALTVAAPVDPRAVAPLQSTLARLQQNPAQNDLLPFAALSDCHVGRVLFLCGGPDLQCQSYGTQLLLLSWLMNPRLNGLYDESDPLLGPGPGNQFAIPGTPIGARCTRLGRYVTVAGGGYFFLPGIRALRFLSEPVPRAAQPRFTTWEPNRCACACSTSSTSCSSAIPSKSSG